MIEETKHFKELSQSKVRKYYTVALIAEEDNRYTATFSVLSEEYKFDI